MNNEITPCPFCGGTAVECLQYDEDGDYAAMFCRKGNCRASGPPVDAIHGPDEYDEEATQEKALVAWNKRAIAERAKDVEGMASKIFTAIHNMKWDKVDQVMAEERLDDVYAARALSAWLKEGG